MTDTFVGRCQQCLYNAYLDSVCYGPRFGIIEDCLIWQERNRLGLPQKIQLTKAQISEAEAKANAKV